MCDNLPSEKTLACLIGMLLIENRKRWSQLSLNIVDHHHRLPSLSISGTGENSSCRLDRMGRKAVLIGCNYEGTKAELKGCINDVRRMRRCLVDQYGFSEEDINVLIDNDDSYTKPTGANIRHAIQNLIANAEPRDYLFIHYSGHGTRLPAETGDDDDTGYDECIVPCDMNLITDDDFRDFVDKVPEGCQITIVSDSCHSGGLIDCSKEQIGESTKAATEDTNSGFEFKSFLKQTISRGIHLPVQHKTKVSNSQQIESFYVEGQGHVINRSLPLSTLIDILKQKTGKEDIDVGKLRPTLFDVFGNDASPKVKKFMKVILDKLNLGGDGEGGSGGFLGMVGSLAQEFLKQKLEGNNTEVHRVQEVYAGSANKELPDMGILISGCQTDQTSADANPSGDSSGAYGALSNAIQTIIEETNGSVTNHELVSRARKLLSRQGFTQRPGLYCSDRHAESNFIC